MVPSGYLVISVHIEQLNCARNYSNQTLHNVRIYSHSMVAGGLDVMS